MQSIVSRNISPLDTAVLSVTRIVGGEAYNVIPQTATLSGTTRAFSNEAMKKMETNMRRIAKGVAQGFGADAEVDYRLIFAPLINSADEVDAIADAAASMVGEANVERNWEPGMGSENFSFMMEKVPGAYIHVGNGPSADLHNPAYNFNDDCTTYGAAMFATLIERRLGKRRGQRRHCFNTGPCRGRSRRQRCRALPSSRKQHSIAERRLIQRFLLVCRDAASGCARL